ncbi:MAG: endonuclease/exonuclease/phosphatase family protein [Chloroflexales bacterium]
MNLTLTIATWNLDRAAATPNVRTQAMHEQIPAVKADIWVLTETHEGFALSGYRPLSTPDASRQQKGRKTTMLWVREDWAMQEIPVFPNLPEREDPARTWPSFTVSSRDTAPAVCAIVETPGGKLLVYGTVITYFGDKGPWGTTGNHQEQLRSTKAHHQDWDRLRNAYPELPFIVAGDFDATCDERNYPAKKTCDALRAAIAENGLVCLSKAHKIDHICVSAEHCGPCDVLIFHPTYFSPWSNKTVTVSDHHGVAVTVTVQG